ncbi:MAG: sensor histidine kinase [Spirochaetales bacterium]|nr:sensor histidine kinase [Spirochaetales bacterium]
MSERARSVAVLAPLGVACHVVVVLQFRAAGSSLAVPDSFPLQFYILVGLSAVFSGGLLLARLWSTPRAATVGLYLAHVLCFVLLGFPLGGYLGIEFSLVTLLLWEGALLFEYPRSIAATAAVCLVGLLAQRPVNAWGTDLPGASSYDVLALALYSAALALALNILRASWKSRDEKSRLAEQLDAAIAQLTSANIGFQQYATNAEERSVRSERNRITREIHDTTGYALTNLMMMMEAASDLVGKEPDRLRELLGSAREQAQAALSDSRRALRALRAVEARGQRGLAAIHKLVKAFEAATGVQVRVEYADAPSSLGEEADLAVYRMVQEGLTNAFKHGKATRIRLLFWRDVAGIGVSLHDNGFGCPVVQEGIGFAGMRERIEHLGGFLKAEGRQDGFELSAWLPWSEEMPSG